jgi:branched-chain amino acid transport system substrate-binding protein
MHHHPFSLRRLRKEWLGILCGVLAVLTMSGCSSCRAEESIDIAAIYALTGVAAGANVSSILGVRLAVDEINRNGGVLNKPLRLLVFDNGSTPIGSATAAERADRARVTAILGSAWSSHSIAVARVAQERGIPMISNYSTSPALTAIGNCIFRVCYTDDFQGKVMAAFARSDLNARTAALFVNLNSDFSLGLAQVFREEFERLGGKVLLELEYKLKQEDMSPLIGRVKSASPDVVFLSGHDESGGIARSLQEARVGAIPIGGDGWGEPSFLEAGGKELNRAYYCSHWTEQSESEKSRSFVQRYSHKEGFGAGAALGYDAVWLLADAIQRSGTPDRGRIRAALEETRFWEGVTGRMDFSAGRDPAKAAVIMEIVNGTPRYLKTIEASRT